MYLIDMHTTSIWSLVTRYIISGSFPCVSDEPRKLQKMREPKDEEKSACPRGATLIQECVLRISNLGCWEPAIVQFTLTVVEISRCWCSKIFSCCTLAGGQMIKLQYYDSNGPKPPPKHCSARDSVDFSFKADSPKSFLPWKPGVFYRFWGQKTSCGRCENPILAFSHLKQISLVRL